MKNYATFSLGFPRIGPSRELKFAEESYFKGELSKEELQKTAQALRSYAWKKQAALDFIPSNDFSYYDAMLDAAVMLGAVPARYKALNLSPLETYFAMAHGYQEKAGDVKALPMKKWFNTNYHYIAPELESDAKISLNSKKVLEEFLEAKNAGIKTCPVVIGPYTFLHLANFASEKNRSDYIEDICEAYKKLLEEVFEAGAEWIFICEPALVFETDKKSVEFFSSLYEKILFQKKIRVALQTYFGDIRESFFAACSLPFDGIGMDFVEGKNSLFLAKDFPKDKTLFAGVVTGKNIWKANYDAARSLLFEIEKSVSREKIVAGFSCSLLHVPYTTKNEKNLPQEILDHFSYAEEKILEIEEIAQGKSNTDFFKKSRVSKDQKVWKALENLSEKDFVRKPDFFEREKIQKTEFNLPLFPTTTIGSFPQTKDVRKNRADYKKGAITKEQYENFNKKKIAECVRLQEELDLDVLVHGEFERNDMVEYFGERLSGFLFTQNAWVQSYGTRCVKPPVIWGDVFRKEEITVSHSVFAQSCTKRFVKGMLTGPVTILNWSFPREDISLKDQALQIALAIREEVLDLEKNGIKIIQIDEAALREKLPLRKSDWHLQYLDWAIPAFRLVHSGVSEKTQIHTHMCYSEFGDIIGDIDNMDADVISFEASRSDLKVLDALNAAAFRTQVGPGVYDIHSPRVPSKNEITDAIKKMAQKVKAEKLWINPDCGLKTRGEKETLESLRNMVAAAKEMRG